MRLCGTVFSKTLDMDTDITVVTPNKLVPGRELRAVYLLHGISGNSRTWLDYSMLASYAAQGSSVYIMPEVGRSFYADMRCGFRYFTYVTQELPEICKSVFHISASRENTAVMGASMGGYGALKCALTYPDRYGMCAAFSSCCLNLGCDIARLKSQGAGPQIVDKLGPQLSADLRAAFGNDVVWSDGDDILSLAKRLSGKPPQLYLTCGTRDQFHADHERFCGKLAETDIPFEYEEWDAGHDFEYFNGALSRAISRFGL